MAPLPLLAHLGHPERSLEMFLTPNPSNSAMAMFGFVYAWYLMVVLLLEIWFDYRADMVRWSHEAEGFLKRSFYWILSLGSRSLSEESVQFDRKAVQCDHDLIGIPSAFMLHGYVGFIFGSVKANPWWSSVLIPIVFLFSAIVSGISLVLLVYYVLTLLRRKTPDMACLDKLASFLLYALILDFSLEMLDFIHRMYESEESIHILSQLIFSRLFLSLTIVQIMLGTIIPLVMLGVGRYSTLPTELKRLVYITAALLVQVGIFSTRWNVVIGGQLFSKSLRGLTAYKMGDWRHRGCAERHRLLDPAVRDLLHPLEDPAAVEPGDVRPTRGCDLGVPSPAIDGMNAQFGFRSRPRSRTLAQTWSLTLSSGTYHNRHTRTWGRSPAYSSYPRAHPIAIEMNTLFIPCPRFARQPVPLAA